MDRCIGKAELIIANAFLLQGISVLQQGRGGKLSLRFPTYGASHESYVLPENKDAYMQMLRVIRMAVKDMNFHAAEIHGARDLSLTACADRRADTGEELWFDLHIEDLCTVKGILLQRPHLRAAEQGDIRLPTVSFFENLYHRYKHTEIFQGLASECDAMINHKPCKDCASLIKDLTLQEYHAQTQL